MNSRPCSVVVLLAILATLIAGNANAEPRSVQSTGAEPVPDANVNVWLDRMVDRFRFEGTVHVVQLGDCPSGCVTVQGKGDCVSVGDGPGVHCILNATWQEMWDIVFMDAPEDGSVDDSPTGVFEVPGGIPYLDPAMALFGLDPGASAIHYLLVNDKGMPEGGLGFIKGNRATFKSRCVNEPTLLAAMKPVDVNGRKPDTCERSIFIDARPDSKVVFMTIEIDINEEAFTRFTLTLRRQPREEEDGPPVRS